MNQKILIVEDDPSIREILSYMLEKKFPNKIMIAEEGQQALDYIYKDNEQFEVIITDINMPNGMGGIELLEKLKDKNHPSFKIVMSGYTKNKENEHLNDLCHHFFEKPLDMKEMIALIFSKITIGE